LDVTTKKQEELSNKLIKNNIVKILVHILLRHMYLNTWFSINNARQSQSWKLFKPGCRTAVACSKWRHGHLPFWQLCELLFGSHSNHRNGCCDK